MLPMWGFRAGNGPGCTGEPAAGWGPAQLRLIQPMRGVRLIPVITRRGRSIALCDSFRMGRCLGRSVGVDIGWGLTRCSMLFCVAVNQTGAGVGHEQVRDRSRGEVAPARTRPGGAGCEVMSARAIRMSAQVRPLIRFDSARRRRVQSTLAPSPGLNHVAAITAMVLPSVAGGLDPGRLREEFPCATLPPSE